MWTLLWLAAALPSRAAAVAETFATDPAARGWRAFGDASLFQWNATNQNVDVTWDSSRTNSLFYRPLGAVLTKSDDFSFSFDLRLHDIAIGVNTNKPYTFEIAIGLCQWKSITNKNFFRGAGTSPTYGPKNILEFDYFPDYGGIGATVAPTVAAQNNNTNVLRFSDNHPLELLPQQLYRVHMAYIAGDQVLRTTMTRNGGNFASIKDLSLVGFPDIRLDTIAIISYSDAMQPSQRFAGSILAHGVVDNIQWSLPEAPLIALRGQRVGDFFRTDFNARSNWFYSLELTHDLDQWQLVASRHAGTNGPMFFEHTASSTNAFYRVIADRP